MAPTLTALLGDCTSHEVRQSIHAKSVDFIITSPPYKKSDGFCYSLMFGLGDSAKLWLKPGGRVFLVFGQLREDFARPLRAALDFHQASGLEMGQTIAWVKSIAIGSEQTGHYQPLNSPSVLNYCWEPVFTFWRAGANGLEPKLDRLAVGVPFKDKGNMKRGKRGSNGDVHCAGDAWFVPHVTTGPGGAKTHPHEFPEALVERALRVAGTKPGMTVLDPFGGGGTTAVVAKRLGLHATLIDVSATRLTDAKQRWNQEERRS
jgi:DNA modification methylase